VTDRSSARPLVAVLDYGIGNLRSAQKGLEHVGADARLTSDAALIDDAAAVVLPGVGAFGRCMDALERTGLDDLARGAIETGKPFFGICVGMQLLYEGSEEAPGRTGLAVLDGMVRHLPDGVKRPQMQWNVLEVTRPSAIFTDLPDPAWLYFVHSYAPDDTEHAIGVCDYGGKVVAAVERDNVSAVQFHPEKSGAVGLQILANFVRSTPS
jgi:glutamine amidotransferase